MVLSRRGGFLNDFCSPLCIGGGYTRCQLFNKSSEQRLHDNLQCGEDKRGC